METRSNGFGDPLEFLDLARRILGAPDIVFERSGVARARCALPNVQEPLIDGKHFERFSPSVLTIANFVFSKFRNFAKSEDFRFCKIISGKTEIFFIDASVECGVWVVKGVTYNTRKRCPIRARNARTLENDVPKSHYPPGDFQELRGDASGVPKPFGLVSMKILKNTTIWRS